MRVEMSDLCVPDQAGIAGRAREQGSRCGDSCCFLCCRCACRACFCRKRDCQFAVAMMIACTSEVVANYSCRRECGHDCGELRYPGLQSDECATWCTIASSSGIFASTLASCRRVRVRELKHAGAAWPSVHIRDVRACICTDRAANVRVLSRARLPKVAAKSGKWVFATRNLNRN